jgi:Fungal specific transcription factor domain
MNALLCFSAKHLSNVPGSGIDPSMADNYYTESMNQMIPLLNDPNGLLEDALLASNVLLRMYEIMKGMGMKDNQYHLWGASSLVSASVQKINVNMRNLRHTAFWAYMRQDVTIALAMNSPTKLNLENCGVELEFTEVDDDIWTNRMTFLLAKTVNYCFGPEEKTMDRWREAKRLVDLWKERAPTSFKPFYTQPHGVHGEPFPAIWLLFPWHSTYDI